MNINYYFNLLCLLPNSDFDKVNRSVFVWPVCNIQQLKSTIHTFWREDPCLLCGIEEFRGGSISYLFSVTAQTQNPYNYFPALQIESNSSFVGSGTFFSRDQAPMGD